MQDNHSLSAAGGTVRGLHCQIAPQRAGQAGALRARRDLGRRGRHPPRLADLRPPRRRRAECGELAAALDSRRLPARLLHARTADTEVIYKVTAGYDRAAERGVIWNDPDLALPWPVARGRGGAVGQGPVLPRLRDCDAWYRSDCLMTGRSWSPAAPGRWRRRWPRPPGSGDLRGSAARTSISTGRQTLRAAAGRSVAVAWSSTPPPIPRSTRPRASRTPPGAPTATDRPRSPPGAPNAARG